MVYRSDTVKLGPPRRLDDGRLIADATLTRTGVFVYRNPDGSERREYRAPDEVFKADSLDTLKLSPVTNTHPPIMIDADNARQYTVGQVGESVRRDGSHVVARIVINDGATVRDLESGARRDTSCGYACDLVEEPGITPEGERYDARQTNINYNHLAIVEAGRAGSARVRMDGMLAEVVADQPSDAAVSPGHATTHADHKETPTVNELEKALAKITELTTDRDAQKARADAADAKAKDVELKLAQAESAKAAETKRADDEKTRADSAEKTRKDADDASAARVKELATLQVAAIESLGRNDKGEVLGVDGKMTIDLDKMDARAIKVAIVEKLDGIKIDEKRSDDAVTYAYELAVERAKKAAGALGAARQTITTGRGDAAGGSSGTVDREAAAKAASKARLNDAWKTDRADKENK